MSEKAYFELNRTFTAAQTNIARVLAPVTGNLVRAFVRSDLELDGGDALFDVNKNGSSIFGDPEDRLKIEDGEQSGDAASLAIAVTQYTDVITVDFDGFTDDAESVGNRLTLVLEFEETGGGGGGGSEAGCLLVLDASQTIPNNTATMITFDDDTVIRDDGGFYNATNDSITIPTTGWYMVTAQIRWEGSTDGDRYLSLEYFGEEWIMFAKHRQAHLAISDPHEMQVTGTFYFAAATDLRLMVLQDSGGSIDAQSPSGESWLGIVPAGKL
jgi:hypothetical protein